MWCLAAGENHDVEEGQMAAVSLLEAVQVGQSGLFAGFLEAGLEEHEAGSCV